MKLKRLFSFYFVCLEGNYLLGGNPFAIERKTRYPKSGYSPDNRQRIDGYLIDGINLEDIRRIENKRRISAVRILGFNLTSISLVYRFFTSLSYWWKMREVKKHENCFKNHRIYKYFFKFFIFVLFIIIIIFSCLVYYIFNKRVCDLRKEGKNKYFSTKNTKIIS